MIKLAGMAIIAALVPIQSWGVWYLLRKARNHLRFYGSAMITDGVVVGTRNFPDGDQLARIFYTVAGTEYMLKGGTWSQWRRYKRGQVVKIYYLQRSPQSGRVADRILPLLYVGGAVLIAATVVLLVSTLLSEIGVTWWLT